MYTRSSLSVIPACLEYEIGISALTSVLVLLVLVTIIGGAAIRFYSIEALQSSEDLVGYRLEQNARVGLEATYTLLNSMGTTTLIGSNASVETNSSSTVLTPQYCNYFPRTDDVILPVSSSGGYADLTLSDSPSSATCSNVRPNYSNLLPAQLDRYTLTNGNASSANTYLTSTNLNSIPSATSLTDQSFRSVFPWVRYRTQAGIMDAQYGAGEKIQTQINQCGLSSNFTTATATGATPVQYYPYLQKMDGLGTSWLNLGNTTMNIYPSGLTLEAWVWTPNSSPTGTNGYQKIFDIGRGAADQNIVLGYWQGGANINFQLLAACGSNPASSVACSGSSTTDEDLSSDTSQVFGVPYNNVSSNTSFDTSGSNDLWYYIAAVIQPNTTSQATYTVYTACQSSSSSTSANGNGCSPGGTAITNPNFTTAIASQKLYQRASKTTNFDSASEYRTTWVGHSHWSDSDFVGMMKNLRVWNTALPANQLGGSINPTYTVNPSTSTIISDSTQNQSLRISPLYANGNDRLLLFTAQETGQTFNNTFRLVSCTWNTKIPKRVTRSLRFRVVGNNRPETLGFLPY